MLSKTIDMLFALLKSSLYGEQADKKFFIEASQEDWNKCYITASKQGVLALAWEGVQRLPLELQPPKQLKFKWAMSVEKYEAKHRRYCQTAQQLQQFYKGHGIVAVQMKGVGFSANYNVPAHREGGDIDMFTYSADTSKMSHTEANTLADNLMVEQGSDLEFHSYKHSNFYYNGIPIENHKCFVNLHLNPQFMGCLNNYLHKALQPQEVELYNGEYKILVPSTQFNTLFISCHAFQHYGSGIALHHLYDWATLVKNYGLTIPKEVTHTKFLRAIAAFTHLCNKYLGTDINLDSFPQGYEKIADDMLEQMLNPPYSHKTIPHTSLVNIFIYKCRRFFRRLKLEKDIFDISIVKSIVQSFVAHIKQPSTIFYRGE